jgi:DNA-binding transcriptional LysR family regulator
MSQEPPAKPLDIDALRLAVALADCGELASAGAAIGIGRRTVAARIAQLERRVGAIIFDHSGKAVRLTAAGDAFVAEARLALVAIERAEQLARNVAGRPDRIAIGATPDALFAPMRHLLEDPVLEEAGLAVTLSVMGIEEQIVALTEGRLTAGLINGPFPATRRLEHRLIASSKWSAVVPDSEARLRKTASLANLARKPLVMIARDRSSLVVDAVVAAIRATGAEPYLAQEAPDWPAAISMVALGLGSALVPSDIAKSVAVPGATVLPLVEASDLPPWPTTLIWLPQPPGSRGAEAIRIIKARFG